MNRLAIFSLRNRALIALVTVVVAIFGGIAMSLLKLELIPSITFPQLVVVTNYPGASPVIVEKEVSTPIETAIQGVNGLEATTATSQNGLSQITAEFAYGTSLESAEQKVQIAINRISSLLPAGVEPQVIAGSFSDIPVLQMAVTSDLTPDQLNQALKDIAVRELTKLDGVREAAVFGANGEHIAIVPNAKKLARLGLTTTDIQTALQTAGIRIGAGSVMSDTGELSIVSGTPLASLSDIRSVPVAIPYKPPVVVAPTVPTLPTIAVSPRETGNWSWDELNGGECIDNYDDADPTTDNAFQDSYDVVRCDDPHDAQLVRVGDLRTDAGIPIYPGDNAIGLVAMGECFSSKIIKASAKVTHPTLSSDWRYPTSQTQWNKGNTFYYCFAHTNPIADITGSVAGKKVNTIVPAAPSASGSSLSSFASSGAAAAPTTRSVTTIGALASVSIQPDTITSISRVNGEPSLTLAITKRADANTVDVSRAVTAALPAITALLGNGTEFTVVFDQAPFIEKSIESLAVEGLLGLFFAIIVILVFLLSIRSTLVTAVSIPTSLLLTFIGMWASNFSLNILTIGAVTISIGRVVDDSIVVVENIKRHLSLGEERMVAIRDGVKEVATAVTASTITTVAVFLPLAFVGGLSGELFQPFAVTVTIALLASLFVSLTIVPVLAYWFLGDKKPRKRASTKPARPVKSGSEDNDFLQRNYRPIVRWTVTHPVATMLVALLTLGGTLALTPFVKTNFVGGSGQSTITLTHSTPGGLTLMDRAEVAEDVEAKLLAYEGIETVQTSIGGGNGFAAFNGSAGSITYQITISDAVDADLVRTEVTRDLETITDTGEIVSAQGGAFGSQTIDITVKAPSEETLTAVTAAIAAAITETKSADSVTTSLDDTQSFISISIKRKAAAKYALSEVLIGRTLSSLIAPSSIGQVVIDDVTLDLIVETKNSPQTLDELRDYKLTTPLGTKVRLSKVATIGITETAASRTTERGVLSASVAVTPTSDNLTESTAAVNTALASVDLPTGTTATVGGVAEDQIESFQQLGLALLAAILIVYVVMVATFRSLRQPLLLLVSIPFAATGAIALQIISGIPLGISSLIGLLMLVGIVVTNAIVLIDLVNQYRDRGGSVIESLLDGTSRRVRPVLMTALATVFALTPLATGVTGSGGFISQPLAIVVIGGLLSSTILTLLVLPALYSLVEGRKERKALRRALKA
ncbi:MAG: efflux RND transporter permease subunit [Microbacteriaceae bacterium]|nr:efflux RND transporter permease subunit [Microbacteriaceae bacterium]